MKVSKSGLFLFELIVVIFLFTVSSAVCISIFAKSFTFSTDSENLTISSMKTETVAEVFKNSNGNPDEIIESLRENQNIYNQEVYSVTETGEANSHDYIMHFYYDDRWESIDENNCKYILTLKKTTSSSTKSGQLLSAEIVVTTNTDNIILETEAKKYVTDQKVGAANQKVGTANQKVGDDDE